MAENAEITEVKHLLSQSWKLLSEIKIGQVPTRSSAEYLIESIRVNADNNGLTDSAFRSFVRSSVKVIPKLGEKP